MLLYASMSAEEQQNLAGMHTMCVGLGLEHTHVHSTILIFVFVDIES